jgi:hypothetical protein
MNPRLQGLLFLIVLLGGIFGWIVGTIGWQEWTIYSSGSSDPQLITAADLATYGPGDNIHVKVADFVLGRRFALAERRGKWNRVWMPLVPAAWGLARTDLNAYITVLLQKQPFAAAACTSYFLKAPPVGRPAEIKIVVQSIHVPDDRQSRRFYDRYRRQPMTGIIINAIHALGSKERHELEKSYPGADFSSVLVLDEGREFPSLQKVLLFLGGGAALLMTALATAVVWVLMKRRARRPRLAPQQRPGP